MPGLPSGDTGEVYGTPQEKKKKRLAMGVDPGTAEDIMQKGQRAEAEAEELALVEERAGVTHRETVASLNMRDADQFVLQRGRSTRLRPIHEARSAPNLGEFAQAEHVAKLLKQGESSHAKRLQLLKDCGVNLVRRVESNRLYEDESFRGDEVRVVLVVVLTVMLVVVVVVLVVVVVVVLVLVLVVVVVVVLVLVVVVVVLVLVLVLVVLVVLVVVWWWPWWWWWC